MGDLLWGLVHEFIGSTEKGRSSLVIVDLRINETLQIGAVGNRPYRGAEMGRSSIVNCSRLGFTSEKLRFFVKEILVSVGVWEILTGVGVETYPRRTRQF